MRKIVLTIGEYKVIGHYTWGYINPEGEAFLVDGYEDTSMWADGECDYEHETKATIEELIQRFSHYEFKKYGQPTNPQKLRT